MNYLPPIIDYTNWTMALSLRKLRAYITGDNQECLEVMGSTQEGIVEGSQTKIEYDTNGNLDIAHINTLLENHPDWINLVVTKWYNQAYNINTNPGVAPFVQYEGPGLAFIAINREIVHDKSNNPAIIMIGEGKFRDHNIEWKDQGILDGHTMMLTHSFASQTNRTGGVGYIGQCRAAGMTFVSPGIKYSENQRHKYGMFISTDVGYINAAPDGEASSIDICLITGRMTNINDERAVLIRKNKKWTL